MMNNVEILDKLMEQAELPVAILTYITINEEGIVGVKTQVFDFHNREKCLEHIERIKNEANFKYFGFEPEAQPLKKDIAEAFGRMLLDKLSNEKV